MSIQVRVKNFQSIKDVQFLIEGFSVITGPNNSGKTALMRAVHGVFTNPSPGPLIRHGEAFLSVELKFSDGTHILWEKGWEKPEQKGKTINRYTINGVEINGVGKGPPPEIEALGVRQISASTERVWPQIAEQFRGVLFLVDRPPSAIAEALSDVDRVGKLSSALKLSEKDRRSLHSELEIRRKDLKASKDDLRKYSGLDELSATIRQIQPQVEACQASLQMLDSVKNLKNSRDNFRVELSKFKDLNVLVDSLDRAKSQETLASATSRNLREAETLVSALRSRRSDLSRLSGFNPTELPDSSRVERISGGRTLVQGFVSRMRAAKAQLERVAKVPSFDPPDFSSVSTHKVHLSEVSEFRSRVSKARSELKTQTELAASLQLDLDKVSLEVSELLGDLGVCPTCSTVHSGGSTHG